MRHRSDSIGANDLHAHRIDYSRTVVQYAAMINRGADLQALVAASAYVILYDLATLVPAISSSSWVLTVKELRGLVQRLEDDPRSVRVVLIHELARHCLTQDVIRHVAEYHDEALAHFWWLKTGTQTGSAT